MFLIRKYGVPCLSVSSDLLTKRLFVVTKVKFMSCHLVTYTKEKDGLKDKVLI